MKLLLYLAVVGDSGKWPNQSVRGQSHLCYAGPPVLQQDVFLSCLPLQVIPFDVRKPVNLVVRCRYLFFFQRLQCMKYFLCIPCERRRNVFFTLCREETEVRVKSVRADLYETDLPKHQKGWGIGPWINLCWSTNQRHWTYSSNIISLIDSYFWLISSDWVENWALACSAPVPVLHSLN